MAHAQTSPAKGKTPKQPDFPTPAELRAFFFLLRDLGWKPFDANPSRWPRPSAAPPRGTKLPTKAQMDSVFAFALEMGWINLNPDEKALIQNLRLTTYKGRNHVYETAAAMRRHCPWVFSGDISHNTEV